VSKRIVARPMPSTCLSGCAATSWPATCAVRRRSDRNAPIRRDHFVRRRGFSSDRHSRALQTPWSICCRHAHGEARPRPPYRFAIVPERRLPEAGQVLDRCPMRCEVRSAARDEAGAAGVVTAKSAAAATEISTIEWKYQIAQRNKIGASNRINPLLGVIKTTQCEEVTGDVGG
jgi:hypothetical protein